MVSDGAFLFHMCIPCSKTFSLVIRSKSPVKVKVKYQGHILKKKKKMAITVSFVFHKHSLFSKFCKSKSYTTSDWLNYMVCLYLCYFEILSYMEKSGKYDELGFYE